MRSKTGIIAISLALAVIAVGWYYRTHPLQAKVRIGSAIFSVDVAVTEAQKSKGLGGRESLADHQGMLFPYDHKEQYNFWMKDMRFSIDFIWIDGKTVADVTENVPPPQYGQQPAIVKPRVEVDKVLEVSAGTVSRLGIRPGDSVEFLDR